MKRIGGLFHKIIYDNKILLLVSIVVAFAFWLIVTISLSPTDVAVIRDVPVIIDLKNSVPAQFDLQIFGQTDYTVDIAVSGKRSIINSSSINKNSVKVAAQTAYVDSAGKHSLKLKITKTNENDEFDIISSSEEEIECYFDVYKEQEFPVEAKLVYDKELTDEGYYSTEPLLSVDSVLVSGPATEVNSVSHVYARAETDSFLTETKTYQTELNAVNDIGSQLHYLTFDNGNADITMTVPVYYSVEKPLSVSFKNSPTVYLSEPLEYTVTPSTVTAGVSGKEAADQMESIEVASIDFAELKPGKNTFSVSPADITGVNFKEETETIEITVEVKNCKTAEFTVPGANISFSNVAQNAAIDKPEKIDKVTIVGPESSLKELTAEDIYAAVDLTDYEEGSEAHRYPAKITVKGSGDCWAYGKYEISLP